METGAGGLRLTRTRLALFVILAVALFAAPRADADTLDFGEVHQWIDADADDIETWAFGTESVTVTFVDSGGVLDRTTSAGSPAAPSTNNFLDPTTNTSGQTLFLKTNGNGGGTGGGPPGPFVDIFVGGVTDVSFTIFDLDTQPPGTFQDRMWMRGHIPGAGTAITDFLAPTDIDPLPGLPGPQTWEVDPLSNANFAVVDGDVENVGGTGDEANRAVVNVSFLGVTIDFIQFRYENMDPASGIQYVSIGDITFTPIPEPNAASLLMLGLVGLAVLGRRCSASPG
jgi:hypothetical protein